MTPLLAAGDANVLLLVMVTALVPLAVLGGWNSIANGGWMQIAGILLIVVAASRFIRRKSTFDRVWIAFSSYAIATCLSNLLLIWLSNHPSP
jgi:hypothetical protein